ncbi:MAG: hypothetical protein ILA04_00080 [Prevotella sp.]|nr:hypothetical protein [Prevotella sp.]
MKRLNKRILSMLFVLMTLQLGTFGQGGRGTGTGNYYWLNDGGGHHWVDIDHNLVFKCTTHGEVRLGDEYFYMEGQYHHVYINECKLTAHPKRGFSLYYAISKDLIASRRSHPNLDWRIMREGDVISIKSIEDYLHVVRSNDDSAGDYNMSEWANVTHSTSENYMNYLNNNPTASRRKPFLYDVAEHGDGTYLLDPSWKSNNDGSQLVSAMNWTGRYDRVYDMTDGCENRIGGYQQINLENAGEYTVQAIVRGADKGKVTLRLSSGGATAEDTRETYGMNTNSTSTVNPFGRVDVLDKGTNAGWVKLETKVYVNPNSDLEIAVLSDSRFQLSDVVLLKDANKNQNSFWTTAGLDEWTTSRNMFKNASKEYTNWYGTLTITYPYYNKFSFFDRGTNLNGVVYAHPKTVIGMYPGIADDLDHRHPCNLATPYFDGNGDYYSASSVGDLDDIRCERLVLTDTDGSTWRNKHAFGITRSFHAKEVIYNRVYKAGQQSTALFPFSLTDTEIRNIFGLDVIKEFDYVEEKQAMFRTKRSSTANVPFMLASEKDKAQIHVYNKDVVPSEEKCIVNRGDANFVGTYRFTEWTPAYIKDKSNPSIYFFDAETDKGVYKLIHQVEGGDIRPFRAFFEIRYVNIVPITQLEIIVDEGDEDEEGNTTAIDGVETVGEKTLNIYSIDGRYVGNRAEGLSRGLYIINGKKVMIK